MSLNIFSGVIWTTVLRILVQQITSNRIDPYVWTGCKFPFFIMYFGFTSSSSLLVIISVEKFIALYYPFKTKSVCTEHIAKRVSLMNTIVFMAFNSQFFFMTKKYKAPNGDYCYYGYISWDYLTILFTTILGIMYSYGPFIIMLTINSAILCKFVIVKWRNGSGNTNSTNQALTKSATTGIGMLLAISVAFITLTSPAVIANAVWPNSTIPIEIFITFGALQNLNHAVNGILYCIVGSRFRNELKKMFQCKTRNSILRPSSSSSSDVRSRTGDHTSTNASDVRDSASVSGITSAVSHNFAPRDIQ